MGRWSRRLAPRFVAWLQIRAGVHRLDVGCGTGALAGAICEPARPDALAGLFRAAGPKDVVCDPIEIATTFSGFDDYWNPLLEGTGPAPAYLAALDAETPRRPRAEARAGARAREGRIDPAGGARVGGAGAGALKRMRSAGVIGYLATVREMGKRARTAATIAGSAGEFPDEVLKEI